MTRQTQDSIDYTCWDPDKARNDPSYVKDELLTPTLRQTYTQRRRQWGTWATARHLKNKGYTPAEACWLMGIRSQLGYLT